MNEHLKKYKNMHSGKRCFVIGSAPTILNYNLLLLQNDFLIGTNQIYKFYKNGLPKIDYYFAGDFTLIEKLYWDKFNGYEPDNVGKRFYRRGKYYIHIDSLENSIPYWIEKEDMIKGGFDGDITKGLYHGYTIGHEALAFAIFFGFNPIYIIGIDFKYKNKNDMCFSYDLANNCMKQINIYCIKKRIKIYNASEYGILDIFPRINYKELF